MKNTKTKPALEKNTLALLAKVVKEANEIQESLDRCFSESAELILKYSPLDNKQEVEDWWADCFYNGRDMRNTLASMGVKFE